MSLLLPTAPTPDSLESVMVLFTSPAGQQYRLRFAYVSDDFNPITGDLIEIEGVHANYLLSGAGEDPAGALLNMFSDIYLRDLRVPAEVALVLDELGHQAVRIVCQRLAGGQLESAVFADSEPMEKHK